MKDNEFIVESVSDVDKYAKFNLTDGRSFIGKYGYFSWIAYSLIGEDKISFPPRVRIDELGTEYFHVEAIFHNGLWVKAK